MRKSLSLVPEFALLGSTRAPKCTHHVGSEHVEGLCCKQLLVKRSYRWYHQDLLVECEADIQSLVLSRSLSIYLSNSAMQEAKNHYLSIYLSLSLSLYL